MTRREFLLRAAALTGCALTGMTLPRGNRSLRKTVEFLAAQQSPDGAWRSSRYGVFREGDALTPLVLWALGNAGVMNDDAFARGVRWLEELTEIQSTRVESWSDLRYPLFTASYSAQVLASCGDSRRANWWADLVEGLRISPALGWRADDPACGAWSDAPMPPSLPQGTGELPDMLAPNISATLLALDALVATGRQSRCGAALAFVAQCQNFRGSQPSTFDDGGFFFAAGDPVRNKAGAIGPDAEGRERYRSYGSATCDGLLALRACGAVDSDPRVLSALAWLDARMRGAEHSGDWPATRRDERESLYFYHAQTLARTLAAYPTARRREQQTRLATDVLARQRADGSWAGTFPDSFEDDPIVATAFAVRALTESSPASRLALR